MKSRTLTVAFLAGSATTAVCVPFVLSMTPTGSLRAMRIAFLAPVVILAYQASLAWTPQAGGRPMFRPDLGRADYGRLALLCVVLAVLTEMCIEPLLPKVFHNYAPPGSVRALIISLPWMALFQPLIFVAAAYAFAARLSRRPRVAVIAVVLAHQGFLVLQLRDSTSVGLAALVVLITGAHALILALVYRAYGFAGPASIALVTQLRHVFDLI